MKTTPLFEIKNVDVFRNRKQILHNFSFTLEKNEHTVVFGPNGSGKSTFLKLLTREIKPFYSENSYIKINGKECINLFHLRKHIGIISADLEYEFLGKRITGNSIVFSAFFGSIGMFRSETITGEHKEKVDEIFSFLDIHSLRKKIFEEMSSGEKKKILLARALVNSPHTLILDEPTNALDIVAQKNFIEIIRKIAQSKQTTIVLVTHHLSEAFPEIQKTILLKKGRIFKSGNKDEIFTEKNIEAIFEERIF